MINYYETLGLDLSASEEEIKAAYRHLAKRFHPDRGGGDPVLFSRISEAYELLADRNKRRNFDQLLKAREMRRQKPNRNRRSSSTQAVTSTPEATEPAPVSPGPPFTRVMSLIMPPKGRFLLEGLCGNFSIQVNHPQGIWDTTTAKFKNEPAVLLMRRVVQIRLHGPREVVRRLRPLPTDFGIQLQGGLSDQFQEENLRDNPSATAFTNGGYNEAERFMDTPVKMTVTLPEGVPLYLYNLSGEISVGDLNSELVATLDQTSVLRGGKLRAANLTLNGRSKAHVADLNGGGEAMVFSDAKLLLDGNITQLRTIIEHQGHVEVLGKVNALQAAVSGRGFLNMKGPVDRCAYDVRASGFMKLAQVRGAISGSRSGAAGVEVVKGPPRRASPRIQAGGLGRGLF